MTDDELDDDRALQCLVAALDPVPAGLVSVCRGLFACRTLEADLHDLLAEPGPTR
jgi:hypothetical protein